MLIEKKHHDAQLDALAARFGAMLHQVELLEDACCDTDDDVIVFYADLSVKLSALPGNLRCVFGELANPAKHKKDDDDDDDASSPTVPPPHPAAENL